MASPPDGGEERADALARSALALQRHTPRKADTRRTLFRTPESDFVLGTQYEDDSDDESNGELHAMKVAPKRFSIACADSYLLRKRD